MNDIRQHVNGAIFTRHEVADMLGCSTTTVEILARDGKLPGLKFGDGGWIFPSEALMQTLNSTAMTSMANRYREAGLAKLKSLSRKGTQQIANEVAQSVAVN